MTEAELKAEVVRRAHAAGWLVYSQPMVRGRRPVASASGYPDLTLARRNEAVWLELKQQKGVLTLQQLAWLRALPWCHVIRPSDLEDGTLARLLA